MSNKTQLQTNNTALDALITRVNAAKDTAASLPEAGGGGGSNITGEWIPISSLPQTFEIAPPPGGAGNSFYYEVPTNCRAVVALCGVSYGIICKYSDDDAFAGSVSVSGMTVTDADNTGTILSIEIPRTYVSNAYLLPLYKQSFMP